MATHFVCARGILLPLLAGLLAASTGCLGSRTPTGTVSGKMTYQGQPVPAGCLVTLIADQGFAALGTVDAQGRYEVKAEGRAEIPAVKYNVSVTYPGLIGPEMTAEDERKFMAGDPAAVAKFSQKPQKSPIPEVYSDVIKSGLTIEVHAGANTYDIDLK